MAERHTQQSNHKEAPAQLSPWEHMLQSHLMQIESKLDSLSVKLDKCCLQPASHDDFKLRQSATNNWLPSMPGEISTPSPPVSPPQVLDTLGRQSQQSQSSNLIKGPSSIFEDSSSDQEPEDKVMALTELDKDSTKKYPRGSVVAWRLKDTDLNNVSFFKKSILRSMRSKEMTGMSDSFSFCFETSPSLKFVQGMPFQVGMSCVIVLHCIYAGFAADALLKAEIDGVEVDSVWQIFEHCFSFVFGIELVIKIIALRLMFLLGKDWHWNVFDSCLVILSILDAALSANNKLENATVARLLRLVRFVRILRVARAIRLIHSLRTVLFTIWESMTSLFWCLLMTFFVIYCFTLLFLSGVTEHFAGEDAIKGQDVPPSVLLAYYGSVWKAMATLFMTITGGIDWREAMLPLRDIHAWYEPIFTFYIAFMCFGVLNVVVGAFVASTTEITHRDKDYMVKRELARLKVLSRDIEKLFQDADADGSNSLSWAELKAHMRDPKVKAYFQALDMDVHHAHTLFKLLDKDGDDQLTLQEFLEGTIRLRGQARSIDINLVSQKADELLKQMADLFDFSEKQFMHMHQR